MSSPAATARTIPGVRRPPRRRPLLLGPVLALLAAVGVGLSTWAAWSGGMFGFLGEPTGWDIAFSLLPYASTDPYWWAFVVGLSNTFLAGTIGIGVATSLGFFVGLGRLSANGLVADLAAGYVNIIRNVPVVLQAMFWYACLLHLPPVRAAYEIGPAFISNRGLFVPWFEGGATAVAICFVGLVLTLSVGILAWRMLAGATWRDDTRRLAVPLALVVLAGAGVLWGLLERPDALAIVSPVRFGLNFRGGLRLPPELVALIVAVAVYRSAFIAEIFRAGLSAVPKGQLDAAHSLALPGWVTLLQIRVPLALISIMPPLGSEFIIIMKITSIGIIVGFMDLFAVSSMSSMMTGRAVQVVTLMTLIYLGLNYIIVQMVNVFNRRLQIKGPAG